MNAKGLRYIENVLRFMENNAGNGLMGMIDPKINMCTGLSIYRDKIA
jgi:hypothetical protein